MGEEVQLSEAESQTSQLRNKRREIITDILQQGLKPAKTLAENGQGPFKSVDPNHSEFIYGRKFQTSGNFPNSADFDGAIKHALYRTDNSILPAVAERQGENNHAVDLFQSTPEERDKISDRVGSSIMVVYDATGKDDDTTIPEKDAIPEKILAILIPQKTADELGFFDFPPNTHFIQGTTTESLYHGDKIEMPDYEGEIKKMLAETQKDLFVSGVRLPNQEDMEAGRI